MCSFQQRWALSVSQREVLTFSITLCMEDTSFLSLSIQSGRTSNPGVLRFLSLYSRTLHCKEETTMRTKEGLLMLLCCAACVAAMVGTTNAFGATLNVPGDYATINAAIIAADPGDTVLCQPGLYDDSQLPVDFIGKAVTVQCASPPSCSLTCPPGATVGVVFENGEGAGSVLSGFTITGASDAPIYCQGSSPTITNCVMRHSDWPGAIGGVHCDGASPVINNCTVEDCDGITGGVGAIFGENNSSPTITICTFRNNYDGEVGAIYFQGGSPTISGCTVNDNNGEHSGGMLFDDSSPTITDCTITGNVGGDGSTSSVDPIAGGIVCGGGSPTISGCTITYNEGDNAGGILCIDSLASPNITDTTVSNNWGYVGGISFMNTSGTISDCNVVNNTGDG
jgi:hypothetical protein